MQLSTVKSVLIGVSAAAAVIAITGAASGTGVGAVFNLGKTNTVNATSSLTGSTKHSMLSVTNKGAGTALSLQVAKGKAPFSVNSSARVAKLNASLLSGLAASQFVQGGGQSRSVGFLMPIATSAVKTLLSLPGFGTLTAVCGSNGDVGFADVDFKVGTNTIDKFDAFIDSDSAVGVGDQALTPNPFPYAFANLEANGINSSWQQMVLRYTTGSGGSVTTHTVRIQLLAGVDSANCDFDVSAIIGPDVTGP